MRRSFVATASFWWQVVYVAIWLFMGGRLEAGQTWAYLLILPAGVVGVLWRGSVEREHTDAIVGELKERARRA